MDYSAFLASLSGDAAVRYRALLESSFSPDAIAALLAGALPPAGLLDPASRERLLLALATSARVFAIDVAEAAVALRARAADADDGAGAGAPPSTAGAASVAPGFVAEAWRRRAHEGRVLGAGPLAGAAEARIVADAVTALAGPGVPAQGGGGGGGGAPKRTA
jgi:hypothetical protein